MARKSAAALAVVPATGPAPAGAPLPPPKHLSAAAREVWQDVTRSRPAEFFDEGSAGTLEAYCVAMSEHRRLSALMARTDPAGDLDTFAKIARLVDAAAARVGSCATRLRITNQARYNPTRAASLSEQGGTWADRMRTNYRRQHED